MLLSSTFFAHLAELSAIAAIAGGDPAKLEQRLKFPDPSLTRGSSVFGAERRAICAKQLARAPDEVICKYCRTRFDPIPAQASRLCAPLPICLSIRLGRTKTTTMLALNQWLAGAGMYSEITLTEVNI